LGRGLGRYRVHVLSAAAASLVDERQLLPRDLDLVAVQQWRGLGPQPHPIDQNLCFRNGLADYDLAVAFCLDFRVKWEDAGES
jgi:hypothetical protein